jgi:hypothetical protein
MLNVTGSLARLLARSSLKRHGPAPVDVYLEKQ